jgi:hypothetical protein
MDTAVKELIFEALDYCYNIAPYGPMGDMLLSPEEYESHHDHLKCQKSQVKAETYYSEDDLTEIVGDVFFYIKHLTEQIYRYGPIPPYIDLEYNIKKAQLLIDFIGKLSPEIVDRYYGICLDWIDNARRLDFPFKYRELLKREKYRRGEVISVEMCESFEVWGSDFVERRESNHIFWVRVGQEASSTKLFKFEPVIHRSPCHFLKLLIYSSDSEQQRLIHHLCDKYDEKDSFWIYKDEKGLPCFSVYLPSHLRMYIGNVGSELGVYVQKGRG